MDSRKFGNRIVFRIDKGEEILASLRRICGQHGVRLGSVQGLGAANRLKIGLFVTATKEYRSRELLGDFEVCPLIGNITTMDGELYFHCHVNVAGEDQQSLGGHLSEGWISATFEGIIDIFDGEVGRKFSEEIGLNLLEF